MSADLRCDGLSSARRGGTPSGCSRTTTRRPLPGDVAASLAMWPRRAVARPNRDLYPTHLPGGRSASSTGPGPPDVGELGRLPRYWRAAHADVPVGDLALRTRCNQLVSLDMPQTPSQRVQHRGPHLRLRRGSLVALDAYRVMGSRSPDLRTSGLIGRHCSPLKVVMAHQ
jgi:hypothetical protein